MKNTRAILTLDGRQQQPDGETIKTQQTSLALLSDDGEEISLLYETAQEDGRPVPTRLILTESALRIEQEPAPGRILQGLCLRTGEDVFFDYETIYGALKMASRTESIRIVRVNQNIHARAAYELCMDDQSEQYFSEENRTLCTVVIHVQVLG